MKTIKLRWGISLEEIGISLMFPTKKEARKAEKWIEEQSGHFTLTKADVLHYARKNNITYGYQIKKQDDER